MKYLEFETALSRPRLGKYLTACKGDKQKAIRLYRQNVRLCQKFYGSLGILEIALRNAINVHYLNQLKDPDWLINQAKSGFLKKYRDRNRIAHHESLCFDKNGDIDISKAEHIIDLIKDYLCYLGYNPKEILYGVELPSAAIEKIKVLNSTL
jgi:hypothetical protein